jgi:predicted  nucleic acid-binding Zn-ribbon protein
MRKIENLLGRVRIAQGDTLTLKDRLTRLESAMHEIVGKEKSKKKDKIVEKAEKAIPEINAAIKEALKKTKKILAEARKINE